MSPTTAASHLDDLQTLLHAMAPACERAGAPGFVERCDAIDLLELHLAHSNADPPDQAERASALHDQAITLCHRLEQANALVVERFRQEIATGRRLGAALLDELQRYSEKPLETDTDGNLEYDHLDVLVAGLLGTDRFVDDGPVETLPEMIPYQPTPARVILEIVKQTTLGLGDTFVDVGAGLGVVPTLVSLLSGAASIGIEVHASYCRHAEKSARDLNISNVRFVCQDARHADLSVGAVFYMYTPFRGAMRQQVLRRLHAEGAQREIRLCTYGPTLAEAVERLPGFERSSRAGAPLAVFHSRPAG